MTKCNKTFCGNISKMHCGVCSERIKSMEMASLELGTERAIRPSTHPPAKRVPLVLQVTKVLHIYCIKSRCS